MNKAGVVGCVCPVGSWAVCISLSVLTMMTLSERQGKMLLNIFFKKSGDQLLLWKRIVFVMVGNKDQKLKHCPQMGFFTQLPGKLGFPKELWSRLLLPSGRLEAVGFRRLFVKADVLATDHRVCSCLLI